MKRFLEPTTVQAIRRWLQEKGVDPFSTPVKVGPYEIRPCSPDELGRPQDCEVAPFGATIWVGGKPTHQAKGEVRRISRLWGLPPTAWEVTGEISPC